MPSTPAAMDCSTKEMQASGLEPTPMLSAYVILPFVLPAKISRLWETTSSIGMPVLGKPRARVYSFGSKPGAAVGLAGAGASVGLPGAGASVGFDGAGVTAGVHPANTANARMLANTIAKIFFIVFLLLSNQYDIIELLPMLKS